MLSSPSGVGSHWLLDFVSHWPDMPLTLHGPTRLGLGLWNSIPTTILVEGALFAGGVWLYLKVSRARDRIGEYGLWTLIALMSLIWLASIFGPPPPIASAVGWVDLGQWLLVATPVLDRPAPHRRLHAFTGLIIPVKFAQLNRMRKNCHRIRPQDLA